MAFPMEGATRASENSSSLSLLFTRDFSLLFLAHLFFGLALWPYVLFPAHLQELGADPFHMGLFMAGASLSGVMVRPFVGHLMDKNGRQVYLLIGGMIFLITHLLYLLPNRLGWALFSVRLLHGCATGILMATFFTLAADLSPPSRRVSGIALFGISGQLSGTIGVTLAEKMVSLGGYQYLFILCAILSGISLFLSYFIREPVEEKREISVERFWKRALHPDLRIPFLTTFLFSLGLTSFMVFLKPYAQTVMLHQVSYFFLAYTISAISIRLIGGDWPEHYGPKRALAPALCSLALGIAMIVLLPSTGGLIVSGIFCGLGHGLVFPILSAIIISRGGEPYRGGFMTLYTLVFDLGALLGSPLFGLMVNGFGYTALYCTAATLVFLGVMAFLCLDPEHPIENFDPKDKHYQIKATMRGFDAS
ncbi:MAG: MFS transporter [Nitrospirae bacterium]|nr:MFS transporter [Candidatus Troglogloeales bacterium]